MDFKELLRTANLLSLVRIPIAVLMVVFFDNVAVFFSLLVIGMLSDFMDGFIARKRGQTAVGAVLDPIGDKLFVGIIVVALLVFGRVAWWHLLVIISRDIFVVAMLIFFSMHPKKERLRCVLKSRWPGKVTTNVQFAALVWAYLQLPGLLIFIIAAAVSSAVAIIDYGLTVKSALAKKSSK